MLDFLGMATDINYLSLLCFSFVKEESLFSHSTTFLIIVSLFLLITGLVLGMGASSWYNHQFAEVGA